MTTVLEVNDAGVLLLPAELLGDAKPHTRYVVETRDAELVLRPESANATPKKPRRKKTQSHEEYMRHWAGLAEQIGRAWGGDKSAAETVSEMRR